VADLKTMASEYTYDAAGNLTTKSSEKQQHYSYDALNRVSTESEERDSDRLYYDSCTNGVGRLCSVSSTDAVSLTTQPFDPEGSYKPTKKISGTIIRRAIL